MTLAEFFDEYSGSLLIALGEHLRLVLIATSLAALLVVPLPLVAPRDGRVMRAARSLATLLQTIPSIALFGLMIPVLAIIDRSIGFVPALVALTAYGLLPILSSTSAAVESVPAEAIDAARGLGMTEGEIRRRILLPLAFPGIIAGIRIAAATNIGVAAVAAYIGVGGLGLFIARGIATGWPTMVVAGVLAIIAVTILVELLFLLLERSLSALLRRGG